MDTPRREVIYSSKINNYSEVASSLGKIKNKEEI
jgi:hypothetical protein